MIKISAKSTIGILFLFLFSCDNSLNDINPKVEEVEASVSENARVANRSYTVLGPYSDASGTVHIKLYESNLDNAFQVNTKSVPVDPDYVIVGGSAYILRQLPTLPPGYGAFLTESRPDFENNSWVASSKDHLNVDQHFLMVTAIGLKLDGVSASELRSRMVVTSNTSTVGSTPSTTATLPSGYTLIGGGAKVNWSGYGNLLVASYPASSTSWFAKSKDHIKSSPASITSYVIGIQNGLIPNFGTLSVTKETSGSKSITSGVGEATAMISTGRLVTCPGGLATYNGYGRMLTGLRATYIGDGTTRGYSAASKDHIKGDSGNITAWGVSVVKQ